MLIWEKSSPSYPVEREILKLVIPMAEPENSSLWFFIIFSYIWIYEFCAEVIKLTFGGSFFLCSCSRGKCSQLMENDGRIVIMVS